MTATTNVENNGTAISRAIYRSVAENITARYENARMNAS